MIIAIINRQWLASFLIIIALCCSGAALGVHYSTIYRNLDVRISDIPGTVIQGSNIHLTSEVSGASGPYSYSWALNSTFYSSSGNLNVTFYNPGLHAVSLSVSAPGGFSGYDLVFIYVHSAPDVFISASTTNVSGEDTVSFTSYVTGGVGPYYYIWYSNGVPIRSGFNLGAIHYAFQTAGSYDIGLKVNNSLGYDGDTVFKFDPWGFSDNVSPAVRQGYPVNNAMANEEPGNASGNLAFHFFLYNPTSSPGESNITVYLYPRLPVTGPSSVSLMNFTIFSGIMQGNSGKWITVDPHIYWNVSSLVVIPQTQTGTSGNQIGVANPAQFNEIFSHYWVPGWDASDDGFAGYWTVSHNVTIKVH